MAEQNTTTPLDELVRIRALLSLMWSVRKLPRLVDRT